MVGRGRQRRLGHGARAAGLGARARWLAGEADLFVWEAFVSGTGKPVPSGITQHAADAAAAADTFADRLEEKSLSASDVVCTPSSSFNLAAAAAAYAGLAIPGSELRDQVQVYRTRPAVL